MCWFAGFTYWNRKLIEKIASTLKKRAIDDENYYVADNYSFYHAHLKISDLDKNTSQPFIWDTIIVWLVWEIYNKSDILQQLSIDSHEQIYTELQIIALAYKKMWADFVNILNWEFAISIYDIQEKKLLLFRDRWGVNNVYYRIYKWELFYASEIKSLILNAPVCSKTSMIHHMIFQFWISPQTILQDIFILRPWTYLEFKDNKVSIADFSPYKYRDIQSNFIETLEKSVIRRIPHFQKRIFLGLSGWPDSNLILYFLKKHFSWEIIAYSFLTDKNTQDINIASENARKHNIKHLVINMNDYVFTQSAQDLYTHEGIVNIPDLNKILKKSFPEYSDIKVEFWWDGKEELILWNNHYPYKSILARYKYFYEKNLVEVINISQEFLNKEMFDYNLQIIDKLSLRSGIERRLPFTDYELLRFFKDKNYRKQAEEFLFEKWIKIVSWEYWYDLGIKFENLYDSKLANNKNILLSEFKKHMI